jgi:hypothetical protein
VGVAVGVADGFGRTNLSPVLERGVGVGVAGSGVAVGGGDVGVGVSVGLGSGVASGELVIASATGAALFILLCRDHQIPPPMARTAQPITHRPIAAAHNKRRLSRPGGASLSLLGPAVSAAKAGLAAPQ